MALAKDGICAFGWKARDFALKGTDGKTYTLADVRGAKALRDIGIGTIAIMPNDTATYREDSFENMQAFAARHHFTFPYVIDETQEVARAYAAQCTPDFFGFNAQDALQYRGRLDASRTTVVPGARRDLFEAMRQVAETGAGPAEQMPSMGCSIKWKD
jgi:peroxiredoxin